MTITKNTHTNTTDIIDEALELKKLADDRWVSNKDRDHTAFTKQVYQPSSPQQAERNRQSVRLANQRYYQRLKAARRSKFLCVNTGAPLRSLGHLVQGPRLPQGWRTMTGKASWQQTGFYQRYGETQADMAKRFGVSKTVINRRWLKGQCPVEYYTRKAGL